jgi:hypothetical protein
LLRHATDHHRVMEQGQWNVEMLIEYLYRAFVRHGINPKDHSISMIYPPWTSLQDRATLLEWFVEVSYYGYVCSMSLIGITR